MQTTPFIGLIKVQVFFFYKREGYFEQQINEIKKGEGGEKGWGVVQIPADDIVRQSLKLKVMSYKSSLNWNVTITVGVISLLLSFRGGLMCTFTFMSRLFRGKRREPRVALANCFSVSKCTFNLFKMRHRITFTFFFLSLTIDPHHETKCQRQSQADFLNRGGGGG